MEQTEVAALVEGTLASRPDLFLLHPTRVTAAVGYGPAAVIRPRAGQVPAAVPCPLDVDPASGRLLSIAELKARLATWEPDDDTPAPQTPAGWLAVVSAQPGSGCSLLARSLDAAGEHDEVLDAGPGYAFDWRWHSQQPPAAVVLTCRASVPGVVEAERLLAYLDAQPGMAATIIVIAALGTAEWPRAVRTASGPLVSATRAAGGVVAVPYVRELDGADPGAVPLPDALVTAAGCITRLAAGRLAG